MRHVLLFYALCCLGNLLFHFVTGYVSSGLQDMKFGFSIAIMFVCLFYSPLCTLLAYVYKITKINVHVIKHPLSYSLFPFIVAAIITLAANWNVVFRDYLLSALFVAENLFIIGWFCYHYYKKKMETKRTKIQ